MTNPLQLLRDFRKWRKERYRENLRNVAAKIASHEYEGDRNLADAIIYSNGILYGIEHRKEILKQVKI